MVEAVDKFESNLEVCYEILLYLSSRLAKLKEGESLEFVTGDPTAADKIPAWVDARGYELLDSSVTSDGRQRFVIRK